MVSTNIAWWRVWAWLIDLVIVAGVGSLFPVLSWLLGTTYWLLRDGLFSGQSIGKRLMGVKVVIGDSRRRCTFRESLIRNLLWVIPLINLVMGATGLYYLFNEPDGRHWGDRLADTRVVKA